MLSLKQMRDRQTAISIQWSDVLILDLEHGPRTSCGRMRGQWDKKENDELRMMNGTRDQTPDQVPDQDLGLYNRKSLTSLEPGSYD